MPISVLYNDLLVFSSGWFWPDDGIHIPVTPQARIIFRCRKATTSRCQRRKIDRNADQATIEKAVLALEAVQRVSGVRATGAISQLMYSEWGWNAWVRYEGQPHA